MPSYNHYKSGRVYGKERPAKIVGKKALGGKKGVKKALGKKGFQKVKGGAFGGVRSKFAPRARKYFAREKEGITHR